MLEDASSRLRLETLPLWLAGYRRLVVTIDQGMRIVSNVAVRRSGESAIASFEEGSGFGPPIDDERFAALFESRVAEAAAGRPAWLSLHAADGRHMRLDFLPRFQSGARQRGLFLLAEDRTEVEARGLETETLRQRLTEILRRAADVIVVADASGRIEEANEAIAALLGWSPEDLVGEGLETLMDEPYRSAHRGYLERYLETGASGILNVGPRPLPARHKDGSVVAIELSVADAVIGGERKFIGVCRGIGERLGQHQALETANRDLRAKIAELEAVQADLETHRRAADALVEAAEAGRREAEEASRAKSRFLATVSHELRTPLNGVLAVADVLAQQPLDAATRELAEIIRKSGQDLLSLLNETLDLSRIEGGGMRLSPAPFRLDELLQALASVWEPAARAKGLAFDILAEDAAVVLVGDEGRLRQVLANLLANAVKFTSRGRVVLEVRTAEVEGGFRALRFAVSDTGPGVEPELKPRLFDPFVTGVFDAARASTGAGLGLAVCRELVGLMAGSIRVEDNPGGGAVMIVELELPDGAASVTAPRASSRPAADHRLRVLVAEDHPVNRRVIALLLDQVGAAYRIVEDGDEAVAAASETDFDIILMDVRMPRMNGLDATRAIRLTDSTTPIIAVTADATPEQEIAMLEAGMNAVLPKPLTLGGLTETLQAHCDARSAA